MGGFLNDGLRDWIAVGGLALALLQTWLAIRSDRAVRRRQAALGAPQPFQRWPKSLKLVVWFQCAAALILFVGLAVVLRRLNMRMSSQDNDTTETISLFVTALFVVASGCGVTELKRWTDEAHASVKHYRAVVYAVHSFEIALTCCAVVALYWAFDKDVNEHTVTVARIFGGSILLWVTTATLAYSAKP